jgi:hypothetical protein
VSRRRQSNLEALIDLAALLPWWVALILGAVSYIVLHAVTQAPVSAWFKNGGFRVTQAKGRPPSFS